MSLQKIGIFGVGFALGWALCAGYGLRLESPKSPLLQEEGETATVERVIDGDTVRLTDGRQVRYIGIDTPETREGKWRGECFSDEATERNRSLVEGREVRLVRDVSDTDKYGRILRYVFVEDAFVNEILVREGFARTLRIEPDTARHTSLDEAQSAAKREKIGLWGHCS